MENNKIQLVIFDMDGLMIDTEPGSKEGWRLALEQFGYDMPESLFSQMLGRNIVTVRELLCSHFGTDFNFNAVHEKRDDYVKSQIKLNGISKKKGLLYILEKIEQMGIKKCVATSTEWEGMQKKLSIVGILDRFDGYVTGDQVKFGKPDPEIFIKAAKLMETEPENCLVLEDSHAGVAAAHAAGMRVIVIPDMMPPDEITLERAFVMCTNLEEAAEIIIKNNSFIEE